jgi:PAS domain-containing protein
VLNRRTRPDPTDPTDAIGYLRQLPALELLNRVPTAMLGVGPLGRIEYANRACAELLGYAEGATVTQLHLPELLVGHAALKPVDCLATLKAAPPIVEWSHREDHVVRTIVSAPMLLRSTDALLLVGITDITEWLWESSRNSTATGGISRSP